MKIEKINDNQIRCTVTMADLNDRHLKISELITNSAKAKLLLQDMVQQAAAEFGFDVDGMSLMIETAPGEKDAVVFTITKMNGNTPAPDILPEAEPNPPCKLIGADSVAHFIQKLRNASIETVSAAQGSETFCIFSFDNLEQVVAAASVFDGFFHIRTSLYKNEIAPCYLLIVYQIKGFELDFSRACNMISEYAALEDNSQTTLSLIKEHDKLLIKDHAIATLGEIS